MEFEDLEKINGVGRNTIAKLEQANYTFESLKGVSVEELARIGIEKSIGTKIISFINHGVDPGRDLDDDVFNSEETQKPDNLDYDINKASETLMKLFKESEEYEEVNEEQSEAVIYDLWRKNLNKKRLMSNY